VVAAVDASLGYPHQLSGPDAPPTWLRPRAFEPVRKVFELAARLLPSDFDRLRAAYVRHVQVRDDVIYTPASITDTMVALLADHATKGNVTVYDPFARFGELLGGFLSAHADPAAVQVSAENPHAAELRLAGMWLAAADAHAQLAVSSSPSVEATFVLANPPFGNQAEPEWLRRCIASLAKNGRAAILMPYGAGFRSDAKAYDLRRDLVDHGAVRAVVALPAQMFPGTSIGVCIWLLQQPTGHAAPVQLVDARTLGRPPGTPEALTASSRSCRRSSRPRRLVLRWPTRHLLGCGGHCVKPKPPDWMPARRSGRRSGKDPWPGPGTSCGSSMRGYAAG